MLPGRIEGANAKLSQPSGWDTTTRGPVAALHVRKANTNAGPVIMSAWFPSIDEINAIQAGAPVIITIVGSSQPVMGVGVGKTPEVTATDAPLAGG